MDAGKKTLEIISRANRFNKWMFEKIEPYFGGKILEVGAGTGNITPFLLDKGEVTCLGISAKCIKALKERFSNSERVSAFLSDISNLDNFREGRIFDTVVCLNVLEHVKNDEKALSNRTSF